MTALPVGFAYLDEALDPQFSKPVAERVQSALNIINEVHWDGQVKPPVKGIDDDSVQKRFGYLRPDSRVLGIHPQGPHIESTLVHEVGHILDYLAIGQGKFASVESKELESWRAAVKRSNGYKNLLELKNSPKMKICVGKKVIVKDKEPWFNNHMNYLLTWWEIWARSYYQWIALKSKSEVLQKQFIWLRAQDEERTFLTQWEDGDFGQLALAMDEAFRALKYMGA